MMKIAVEGCCHGRLDDIYDTLIKLQEKENIKIDLLLCCGDFQAVRNHDDLDCMAVPNKYKEIGTFYKYYTGEKVAPILTIFIGGNHEASNHLRELGYGGWAAPNIYYIGFAGAVQYGGLRIGGLSGIYKYYNYRKGHFETPPFSRDTVRSVYHIRSSDVQKLKMLSGDVDIMMSHDWPLGIHRYGNCADLFRKKPYFEENADNELGSPPAMELLQSLRPSYWFSAHLHCKYPAIYRHQETITKFLALDKCLPRRQYLQVIDVPSSSQSPPTLQYDPEWLAILKLTDSYMSYTSSPERRIPPIMQTTIDQYKEEMSKSFDNDFTIPFNFEITAPPYTTATAATTELFPTIDQYTITGENPQTKVFCERLGIDNPWISLKHNISNPEEINLSEEEEEENMTESKDTTYPWLIDSSSNSDDEGKSHEKSKLVTPTRTSLCLPPPVFSTPSTLPSLPPFSSSLSLPPPILSLTNPDEITLDESEEEEENGGEEDMI